MCVKRSGRENIDKVDIPNVWATIDTGKEFFIRIHPQKVKFFRVCTSTLVHARLNAQKTAFLGVYLRFSKILSAWVVTSELFINIYASHELV